MSLQSETQVHLSGEEQLKELSNAAPSVIMIPFVERIQFTKSQILVNQLYFTLKQEKAACVPAEKTDSDFATVKSNKT